MSLPAAVLWDLDGTLIDTEPYWIACEHELVAAYGGQWTDADAKAIVGFDLIDAAEVIRSRGGVPLRPHDIVDRLLEGVIAKLREHIPWRPGARELLASLRVRGVPCALVTMSWKSLTDVVVPALPPGSFHAVITGDMVMNGKPHPEPYRRAAEELRVDPLSCVAIEDSPTGIASAEAAGCVVVAVQNMVPLPPAPHRVMLDTLRGITPEHLGGFVESTPAPDSVAALEPEPVDLFEEEQFETIPPPDRAPDRGASALRFMRDGTAGFGALLAGRGRTVAAVAAALLLLIGGIWYFAIRDTEQRYEPGPFRVFAWVPSWDAEDAFAEFDSRGGVFHGLIPFWYEVTGVSTISTFRNTPAEATNGLISAARNRRVPLIVSLFDQTAPRVMASLLADPESRAQHIEAIASFAASNGFDGIDLNYENFAFEDGRDTWATTRPAWVTFVRELAARLHGDGRLLTVSVPPVYDDEQTDDSGYWVYDYGAIVDHVDAIRVMAYDFSVSEPGPIAPIDWVEEVIDGTTEAAGGPEKLVLGIPLYGRNWVIATSGECPDGTPGRQEPELSAIADLIERRDGEPTYNAEHDEWTFTYQVGFPEDDPQCTQSREVHYVDADGVQRRMQMSIDKGMLGVSLFAFGYENAAVWDRIDQINATLETTVPA